MDTNAREKINLHFDTLPANTKKALDFLSGQEWIGKSNWYLAGGTALSLQTGHRRSVDLDFFTQEENFSDVVLLNNFSNNENWKTTINQENTIYGELYGAKVSFIAYPFFMPKQGFLQCGFVKVLRPIDIAVMKVIAISQRGRKRDFFDLYWCAKNIESLEETIKRLKNQYPSVAHDYHHILKSLVYFNDAQDDPMPEIDFSASWNNVKTFFEKEVPKIAERIMEL
ncbi:MAG: Uncharacterized protein Athens071425_243 [Parcubacteria group bacterium Athens0714_25]|nr:MAG: Uncharacterized protein Athens071425_243 [Parcubacteria group bacterium Athens0714_25]